MCTCSLKHILNNYLNVRYVVRVPAKLLDAGSDLVLLREFVGKIVLDRNPLLLNLL